MATKISIGAGVATGVYDDRLRPIFEALGVLSVKRASEVEYEEETGDWVARLLMDGREIGRGKNRADVIKQEVEFLEGRP